MVKAIREMSEVICIKNYPAAIRWQMQTHGIVPPSKGEVYHIIATEEREETTWYKFAEYPDTVISHNYGYTHWFECVYFSVIDTLNQEIASALVAPKPKEFIILPGFTHLSPHLSLSEASVLYQRAKFNLMRAKTIHEFKRCTEEVNKLHLHILKLTHNA